MNEKEYQEADTVVQLRAWARVHDGSYDYPSGMMNWGQTLRDLHTRAADEIERLREVMK